MVEFYYYNRNYKSFFLFVVYEFRTRVILQVTVLPSILNHNTSHHARQSHMLFVSSVVS